MRQKLQIKPELLRWVRERADLQSEDLRKDFPKLAEWERGEAVPRLKQLERFARKVHTPIGYLFLDKPPEEPLPIQDFRTQGGLARRHISVNARDMIYLCQRRQDWYHDYAIANGLDRVDFAEQYNRQDKPACVAQKLRAHVKLAKEEQYSAKTKTEFLCLLREKTEEAGVLVMISGIVGSNTHRPLDVEEFRGFALADAYAPLIFINGKDAEAGKIFTLAHELAHICLGETGISDAKPQNAPEQWCNAFAAEFLVPATALRESFQKEIEPDDEIERLSRLFKVSRTVITRRLADMRLLSRETERRYMVCQEKKDEEEAEREKSRKDSSIGGNYYNALPVQISKRFLKALYASALEGQTLYRDALRLVGTRKIETFKNAAEKIKRVA